MRKLASAISKNLEGLAGEYEHRLRGIQEYAAQPKEARLDDARHDLNLIAACLKAKDDTPFIQFVQDRVSLRIEQRFTTGALMQALTALEETISPLVTNVGSAGFLWRAFSQARSIVAQQTAEALREERDRAQSYLDIAGAIIVALNAQGEITLLNKRGYEALGYQEGSLIGQNWFDVTVPAAIQDAVKGVFQQLMAGEMEATEYYENELLTRDGSTRTVAWHNSLLTDRDGNIIGTLSSGDDITERKQAEGELQKLASVVQYSGELVNLATLDGQMIFLNEAGSKMLGIDPTQVEQANIMQVIPEQWLDLVQTELLPTLMEAGTWEGELQYRNIKTDELTDVQAMTFTIRDPDTDAPLYLANVSLDITERKRLEREIHESLQRRTQEVQLSTEVAQEVTAAPALDELYHRVVTLVKERFGYYHVQIFRHDPDRNVMAVVKGYGAVGETMKAAGHSLPYGTGVVGTAAATGEPVLASDVIQDPHWVANPNLPATRGELAVPIKLRDQVLGVLDVQSDEVDALSEEDQVLLLGLAGQIASAIESTQALEQARIFRQFAEASGQGMGMATLDGRIIYVNPTLCRILGEDKPEDVIGNPIATYYPTGLQQRLQEEVLPATMQTGQWTGELALRSRTGTVTPTIETLFLIRDEQGNPLYLADVMTDITERKQIEAQTQETLHELERLARIMSREGWDTLRRKTGPIGYRFDQIDVVPVQDLWVPEIESAIEQQALVPPVSVDQPTMVMPLSVRGGEIIGVLGIQDDPQRPLSQEEQALVESIAEQVALALEGSRLFEQIQEALAETETMYVGSERVVRATTMEDVLRALIESTALSRMDRASLNIFDHPWDENDPPEGMMVAASWTSSGWEPLVPVGTYHRFTEFPAARLLGLHEPSLSSDILSDERFDPRSRQYLVETLKTQGVIGLPLILGGRSIGGIIALANEMPELGEAEMRQITSLAEQAATVIQSQRLFAQTQEALAKTETLYEASRAITAARDQEEIVAALLEHIDRTDLDRIVVVLIAGTPEGQPLAEVQGVWDRAGQEQQFLGNRFTPAQTPLVTDLSPQDTILIDDIDTTDEVDEHTRNTFKHLGVRAAAILPISAGQQTLGWLSLETTSQPREFTADEIRRHMSLANQAAVVLEGQRLLSDTERRAQREQLIREITTKLRASTDLDTILSTAVRELNTRLGTTRTFVHLSTGPEPEDR